jgi:hypothetical protein
MSVDDRLRNGLAFDRTEHPVDVERLLRDVERAATRRRRTRIATALVAAACIVALLAIMLTPQHGGDRSTPPTQPDTENPPSSTASSAACNTSLFICVEGVPQQMAMGTVVRWEPQPNFGSDPMFTTDRGSDEVLLVEMDRSDVGADKYAGVDIVQHVRAPSLTRTGRADPTVAVDPEAIANWLAQRPDLASSAVRPATIDGRRAWSVTVRTKIPDKDATVECNDRFACTPIMHVDGAGDLSTQGLFEGLLSRFTFLQVPDAGVVVIWSWALPDNPGLLRGNRALIDSIEFD